MDAALVINGVVDTVYRGISDLNELHEAPNGGAWIGAPDGTVCAGMLYDGEFSNPEPPAPSTDPADYPLLPWQFKAMVIFLGVDAEVQAAIGGIPNAMQRAAAVSRYLNASYYRYDDALLQSMRAAIGMSNETLAEAWMQAKDLTSGA